MQNITAHNKNDLMNQLVNPQTAKLLAPDLRETLRTVLFTSLHGVYLAGAALIIVAFVLTLLLKKSDTI